MIINADAPWIYYKDGLLCILLPKLPVCLFFFFKDPRALPHSMPNT